MSSMICLFSVIDLICDDIGHKWKDLARRLEIKEGTILEIDGIYRNSSAKCRAVCIVRLLIGTVCVNGCL